MALKDLIAFHTNAVYMNTGEFADDIVLQVNRTRVNIKGSLQSNTVQNNSGNTAPLQSIGWTLYTPYPIQGVDAITTGMSITINDIVYKVDDISDEMGLATIKLHRGSWR